MKNIFIGMLALVLSACGGGGGGGDESTPTDPNLPFSLFPDTYFVAGHTEAYSLTGSDTRGGTYDGSLLYATDIEDVFDGISAIPLDALLELTNLQTNAFLSTVVITYFSIDPADRRLLGEEFDDGVISFAQSTDMIPEIATIDDFGVIGNYSASDGTTSSAKWRLENANNGRAYLIIAWEYQDAFGNFEGSEEQQYLIDPDGTRLAVTLRLFFADENVTLTLSGNRN